MKREKVKISWYVYWSRNLANMLWWKLLFLFGVRRSALPIPEGMYCYAPDVVGRSEQLKAFLDYVDSRYSEQGTSDKIVDEFLSL